MADGKMVSIYQQFKVFKRIPAFRKTQRQFSVTSHAQADFQHAVIGAGVVGLAVARTLAKREDGPVLLLERRSTFGTEISSRNSEVIHAGIYYGPDSLKTKLCLRGKQLLYGLCESRGVPFKRTGKWIVAQNDPQNSALEDMYRFCTTQINVPMRWVGQAERESAEPDLRADAAVLESPTTGIIDSHGLMMCLLGDFEDSGGTLAVNSNVVGVDPVSSSSGDPGSNGWEIRLRDEGSGDDSVITTETLINSAGLGSAIIHNMPLPEERHIHYTFAKGNYFAYSASSPKAKRLIYPAPEPGHGGLGTHLTLDLSGRIRFGPDLEWVDSADDLTVSDAQLGLAIPDIKTYLPTLDESSLTPDYCGIRPKLSKKSAMSYGAGFADFVIQKEDGLVGWVNLLGIESPGLTSCLAIGERVERMLYS